MRDFAPLPSRNLHLLVMVLLSTLCSSVVAAAPNIVVSAPETVLGDGSDEHVIRVRRATGRGRLSARYVRGNVSAGELGPPRQVNEAVEMTYTAPRVAAKVEVQVRVAVGRWPAAEATIVVEPESHALVQRKTGGPLDLRVPTRIVLGEHGSAQLSVDASRAADIRLAISPGRLRIEGVLAGRLVATYIPPSERFPRTAVVIAVGGDGRRVDWATIPLSGRPFVQTQTRRDTMVRIRIGSAEFGPFVADGDGRASIAVLVPPGFTDAEVVARHPLGERQKTVPLGVKPRASLAGVCAAGGEHMLVAYVDGAGTPSPAAIEVDSDGGRFGRVARVRTGLYRVPFVRRASLNASAVTLRARVRGTSSMLAECELPGAQQRDDEKEVVAAEHEHWLGVSVQGGVHSNFGSVVAPLVTVQLTARLPWLGDRLIAGVTAGVFSTSMSAQAGDEQVDASLTGVPVMARVAYEFPFETVVPFLAAEGGVMVVSSGIRSASSGETATTDVRFAASGLLGAVTVLGPGAAILEAGYTYATMNNEILEGHLGGLRATGGYRHEF